MKMSHGDMDLKLVKQEIPEVLFEDTCHRQMMDMTSCYRSQENLEDNNAQSRMSEDRKTLAKHQIVSSVKMDNDYTASQHSSFVSESVPSMVKINTQLCGECSTNENFKLQHVKIPVEHIQVAGMSLDNSVGNSSHSSLRIQAGDTPSLSDDSDGTINVNRYLNKCKTTDARGKMYKCDDCGAFLTEADQLTIGIITHTGEKPYKCDLCGKCCFNGSNRKYHKRTHTGEKPYKCDLCGASFIIAGSLKCYKRIHTGEKPYKCDDCGASFSHLDSLKYHMGTHTGEKPYKCHLCFAYINQACSLKLHMRTHTGEKPDKCDLCSSCFYSSSSLKHRESVANTCPCAPWPGGLM